MDGTGRGWGGGQTASRCVRSSHRPVLRCVDYSDWEGLRSGVEVPVSSWACVQMCTLQSLSLRSGAWVTVDRRRGRGGDCVQVCRLQLLSCVQGRGLQWMGGIASRRVGYSMLLSLRPACVGCSMLLRGFAKYAWPRERTSCVTLRACGCAQGGAAIALLPDHTSPAPLHAIYFFPAMLAGRARALRKRLPGWAMHQAQRPARRGRVKRVTPLQPPQQRLQQQQQ